MPTKNGLYGVYKTLKVNGAHILAEKASQKISMPVEQKNFIQGTAKNRIMDIGGITENITVEAPILIGGGSVIDGRTLLNRQIKNLINPSTTVLPLLEKATLTVSGEAGGKVSLELISDGAPISGTPTFEVRNEDSSVLTGTKNHATFSDVLNPDPSVNPLGPTREAKFYDFRVSLAGFQLYVLSANISVEVTVDKKYFLAGNLSPSNTDGSDPPVPVSNTNNFGTQFPYLGITGLKVSGRGEAAVLLNHNERAGYGDNVNLDGHSITTQTPGSVTTVNQPFSLEVYDTTGTYNSSTNTFSSTGGTWVNLFNDDNGVPLFDLSQAVVKSTNLEVSTGLIKSSFEFVCYVK